MPPYATGRDELPDEPPTIDYLMNITNQMAAAIKVLIFFIMFFIFLLNYFVFIFFVSYSLFNQETHGMDYEVGQSRDVVGYAAGGTTEDFAYLPEPQGIVLKKNRKVEVYLPRCRLGCVNP